MTRDDIIRMVEESGLDSILREWLHEFTLDSWVDAEIPELERFAALVAAEKEQQMIRDGWRKCAEGQSTTQYCAVAEAALRYRDEP